VAKPLICDALFITTLIQIYCLILSERILKIGQYLKKFMLLFRPLCIV